MKIPLVIRARKWSAAVLAVLFFAADRSPAQFLEVSVRVESVLWPSIPSLPQIEHRHTNNVRCVFGTNLWMMRGGFALNAKASY